jgi:diaminopimelate epimerase
MKLIKITKMHGNGNDFILVDEFKENVIDEREKPDFVRAVCHRYFGIGADGVLFVQPSEIADVRFRYFNSDGSEAAMCGNGIRCFSRYVVEEGYTQKKLRVETLAGVLELEVFHEDEWWVKVDMGKPKFEQKEIPANVKVWGYEFEFDRKIYRLYAVNTGVPHVVVFVDNLEFDIIPIARKIRYSEIFPEGTNVNFAKVEGENKIRIRTYERGVEGETLSCGTGSVAVAAIANRLGITGNRVEVLTKGGLLKIEVNETAYMLGTANRVLDGNLRLDELRMFRNLDLSYEI